MTALAAAPLCGLSTRGSFAALVCVRFTAPSLPAPQACGQGQPAVRARNRHHMVPCKSISASATGRQSEPRYPAQYLRWGLLLAVTLTLLRIAYTLARTSGEIRDIKCVRSSMPLRAFLLTAWHRAGAVC